MKLSHFNKKRIIIAFTFLIILLLISIFCSFSFRPSEYEISYYPDRPSLEAVQNLMSIIQYQKDLNGLNRSDNILILACKFVNNVGYRCEVFISSNTSFNYSTNGDIINFNFSNTQISYYNDSTGFYGAVSIGSTSLNIKDIYYSSLELPETSIPGFQGFNSNATFGKSNFNSSDVMNYFKHIHDAALYLDEYVSEAFSEGFSEGESIGFDVGRQEGYEIGYDDGYQLGESVGYSEGELNGFSSGHQQGFEEGREEGYSEGESVGYSSGHRDGFDQGREEGYTLGFDVGYESGYTEGYSEGYETGYQSGLDNSSGSEPLQIYTAYIFRFDENNSIQYSYFNDTLDLFFWVDYESKFDPTKPPYTFIVKLTESDINNSSTQIELPFDFISSPGNRDYSVASFDSDFLTGYGNSISLFVSTSKSYNNGYNVGLQDGADILDGISDISAKPISALRQALDFELFGINIGLVVIAIVSVLIVFAAYKFVKKIFPI